MRALRGHNIMGRRTPAWPSPLAYLVGTMATKKEACHVEIK